MHGYNRKNNIIKNSYSKLTMAEQIYEKNNARLHRKQ